MKPDNDTIRSRVQALPPPSYSIYALTCENTAYYVGLTMHTVEDRVRQHHRAGRYVLGNAQFQYEIVATRIPADEGDRTFVARAMARLLIERLGTLGGAVPIAGYGSVARNHVMPMSTTQFANPTGMDADSGLPVGFTMPEDDGPELINDQPCSVGSSGWGPDPAPWFDDDLAMDFVGDVQSAGSWEPVVRSLEHPDDHDDRELVAACALVACAVTESLGLDLGFDDLTGVLEAPPADLVAAAEETARRIRETEGTDLHLSIWEAPGKLCEPWLASLERMERHLASSARCP